MQTEAADWNLPPQSLEIDGRLPNRDLCTTEQCRLQSLSLEKQDCKFENMAVIGRNGDVEVGVDALHPGPPVFALATSGRPSSKSHSEHQKEELDVILGGNSLRRLWPVSS